MEIAVYLFTGFLEAGKTKFIAETMRDPNFNDSRRKYLIITCEEGEEEIDPSEIAENVSLASFDDVQKITPDRLSAMQKRAGADIVVVEYNGMWTLDNFYNSLPENWMVYQEIFIADSNTILSYNANMRQLVVDKLTSCEMAVFNRVGESTDKMALHKLVRGVSRKANICYEDTTGEIEFDQIEDPLPYDINSSVIEIKDEDFAIFYRDMTEDYSKYDGKTIRFKGIVALDKSLPNGHFAIGRHIMTCCEADIAYRGVVAKGMGALKLSTRDWITVEGKLSEEYSKLYRSKGPVLEVKKIQRAEKPVQEVATFY
ncbi:MAG: TIGR03943 family protein [Ruminococcaceae bacterium]|nr:TIGR03943 family protein [Oscillospiraceae bacterium]